MFHQIFTIAATAVLASSTLAAELKVGDKAPAVEVKEWIQGETTVGAGKPYVVEFWATWCGPCRQSIPHLNDLYKKYKGKGLSIIGVIYGAMVALMQTDWKRLVAYSSVSHLGLAMVGIFVTATPGSVASTRNSVVPWPVCAATISLPATLASETNIFTPFSLYPSP